MNALPTVHTAARRPFLLDVLDDGLFHLDVAVTRSDIARALTLNLPEARV